MRIQDWSDVCVICGKGPHQPSEDGEYVGKKDIPCVCGKVHVVCFTCWTDPECKVLAEAFSSFANNGTFLFMCPKDIKVAMRMMD